MNQQKGISSGLVSLVWKFIVAYKKHAGEQLSYVDLINSPDHLEQLAKSCENAKNGELAAIARQIVKELDIVPNDEDVLVSGAKEERFGNVFSIKAKDWVSQTHESTEQTHDEIEYYGQLVEQFCIKGGVYYQDRLFLDHCLSQLKISDPQAIKAENIIRRENGLPSLNWALEFHGAYSKLVAAGESDEGDIAKLYGVYGRPTRLSLDQIDHIVKQERVAVKPREKRFWHWQKMVPLGLAVCVGIGVLIGQIAPDNFNALDDFVTKTVAPSELDAGSVAGTARAEGPLAATDAVLSKSELRPTQAFNIHGSNTIGASLAPRLVVDFLEKQKQGEIENIKMLENEMRIVSRNGDAAVSVDIEAHGSSTGFKGLLNGVAQIAASSRPIKAQEITQLNSLGVADSLASEHVIALDGVAVIVHVDNPVNEMSKAQLRAIFSGKLNNWQFLGGANRPITVYARDAHSGTFDTFKSLVLGKNMPLTDTASRYESNEALSNQVSQDIDGIGFVPLNSIRSTKAVAISDGSRAVFPTPFTVATEDYPLTRRLYFYTPTQKTPSVRDFVQYSLSDAGQSIVSAVGYVNLIPIVQQPYLPESLPAAYQDLVTQKKRMSVSFRFISGTNQLDTRAYRDLDRVVRFMLQPENRSKRLTLIGFSDAVGEYWANIKLSENRAVSVASALTARGLVVETVAGLGPMIPVADNSTAAGRYKNRRVEVWISE